MAIPGPANTIRTVEIVDLCSICIEFPGKHEFGKLAIARRWPRPRTSDAIQVAIKDARVASIGVEENKGVSKGHKPRFDGCLERLAFLGIVIVYKCLHIQ